MFGSVFAREMLDRGKKVLIIDQRSHLGGNCYTDRRNDINVHVYGPHIFHTNSKPIWTYINRFAEFNHFVNRAKVNYKGQIYSFPINLMTMYQMFGATTPAEARAVLDQLTIPAKSDNLESWALSQVGKQLYETFIHGYTKKQWMREPRDLPSTIIKRLPIRFTYDDNYYNHRYQGIPIGGYTQIFHKLIDDAEVKLNCPFEKKDMALARKTLYTGRIDEFFDYSLGDLEYRSLRFEHYDLEGDYQGVAQMNYTEESVPYTRSIEHKHFEFKELPHTIVTLEYPDVYDRNKTPYYPVGDDKNQELHGRYLMLAKAQDEVIFGGRLGHYKYFDMDQTIGAALALANLELKLTRNQAYDDNK